MSNVSRLIIVALLTSISTPLFAASTADNQSIVGKWLNPAFNQSYTINSKGVVGLSKASCDGPVKQRITSEAGSKWLAVVEGAGRNEILPKVAVQIAQKAVQKDKIYIRLQSQCGESSTDSLLIAPDTLLVLGCSEAECDVSRHARVH